MVQMDVITSLKIVKDELDSNISKASTALEQFAGNTDSVHHLSECRDLLRQASSVLKLLEFDGATHLLNEMVFLLDQVQNNNDGPESARFMEQMASLGLSLIQLEHFLEYTLLKERHIPGLLASRINGIRKLMNQRPLPDATFSKVQFHNPSILDLFQVFGESIDNDNFKLENVGPYCKPFRLMFQVGLLSVLKEKAAIPAAINLMNRSLQRLCGICGAVPLTKLWFLGRVVLVAFLHGNVSITPSRLFLLSKIERQIKQMVYGRDELLQMDPPEHIVLECLTLLSVASTNGGATKETTLLMELKDVFNAHALLSDVEMQEEGRLMNGPTGTVIQSVVQLIYGELAPLKAAMDLRARKIIPEWQHEVSIHSLVEQTAHTLNMVGEMESAALLKEQMLILEVLSDAAVDIHEEQLQSLADTFIFIEQSLAKLLGSYAVEPEDNNENMLSPRSVLEQARHLVFVESRASLGVVKRAVASYVDSHGDGHFLDQVKAHLLSTVGALHFLHLDRAGRVLLTALTYIDKYMIEQDQIPTPAVLEVVADVLMSVDYYLESLEDRKSIGEGVLEAAELSVNMLKQAFEQSSPSKELEGTDTQG